MNLFYRYIKFLWHQAEIERRNKILSLILPNEGSTLLDCGCDDGSFTMQIANKLKAQRIIGIEINEIRRTKASQNNIEVYNSDLNLNIPLENSSVDVITADQVIEHLIDIDKFINEIKRVLKPKGYAVICTDNLASTHNIFALLLGLQPYSGPTLSNEIQIGHHPLNPTIEEAMQQYEAVITGHTKVMTITSLKEIFKVKGFNVETSIGVGYLPFSPNLAKLLVRVDKRHSLFIMIKAIKP
ncbi:MAG: methyltransferase domain-containing protein [Nitrospirae bacterium]|nr:methyltransferase domain-containing protein [Nitrospirota bacterium]